MGLCRPALGDPFEVFTAEQRQPTNSPPAKVGSEEIHVETTDPWTGAK